MLQCSAMRFFMILFPSMARDHAAIESVVEDSVIQVGVCVPATRSLVRPLTSGCGEVVWLSMFQDKQKSATAHCLRKLSANIIKVCEWSECCCHEKLGRDSVTYACRWLSNAQVWRRDRTLHGLAGQLSDIPHLAAPLQNPCARSSYQAPNVDLDTPFFEVRETLGVSFHYCTLCFEYVDKRMWQLVPT